MTSVQRQGDSPLDPLAEWAAAYDDALMAGKTPPDPASSPQGQADQQDSDRLRDLLQVLHHALRVPGEASEPESAEPEQDAPPPLGRFVIERELGRGGYGVVYLAYDPSMDRRVALKIPCADALLDPGIRRRFLREARAAARLDHPNLVPVFEADEIGPICYIASAFCEGPTLAHWLSARSRPLEPRQAARLTRVLARAVDHIHQRGLLHGDLKPGNILLESPGQPSHDPIPRITDFGLSRAITPTPGGSTTRPLGTPPYMAPEQIEPRSASAGPLSDLYALGAILYEMLTGAPPHASDSPWLTIRAVLLDPPARPRRLRPGTPRDLESICLKCLEKTPASRYSSAIALADDLDRFLENRPTHARPIGLFQKTTRWCRRRPAAAAFLGMGILVVALTSTSALMLARSNQRLQNAGIATRKALDTARRQRYVATLALAQEDARSGRVGLAQRRLRSLIPGPSDHDERDFAWHYLYRRTRQDRTNLTEVMTGQTSSLSSSEGLLMGASSKLGLWDFRPPRVPSGTLIERPTFRFRQGLEHLRPWTGGALSPNGRLAVINHLAPDGTRCLKILDPRNGRLRGRLDWPALSSAGQLRFDTSGRRIAVGLELNPNTSPNLPRRSITLDDGQTLTVLGVPSGHRFAFSPKGHHLYALCVTGLTIESWPLQAWNLASKQLDWSLPDEVLGPALAVSPDPEGPIASTTLDGLIQLRSPSDGTVLAEWPAHDGPIHALAFSPDGAILASGTNDLARLWDVRTHRPVQTLRDLRDRVNAITFLAGTDDLALGLDRGRVVVWHVRPLSDQVLQNAHEDEVWGLACSSDGRWLASVGGDHRVVIRDSASGRVLRSMIGRDEWPSRLALSPSGHLLAVSDFGGYVQIWNPSNGRLIRTFRAHPSRICSLAFSPDGRVLATAGRDGLIHLWDSNDWHRSRTLEGHRSDVSDLAFFPDGRRLASASNDRSIILWDIDRGAPISRRSGVGTLTCVAVSRDGAYLASGDNLGGVVLRAGKDGSIQAHLTDLHSREISDLAFSPDGRVLAVAGQDRIISLIDVSSSQPHLTLMGHTAGVNRLAFSPDGRVLASASHDHSIRLWRAGP